MQVFTGKKKMMKDHHVSSLVSPKPGLGMEGVADNSDVRVGQTVMRLRSIVFMVLVVSTTALGFGIYYYFRQSEDSHFRDAFHNDATKLHESILGGITQTLMCMDTLAVTVISYAESSNATWPFVTVPHFAVHGAKFLKQAPVLYFQFIVNVADEDRLAWEAYSHENNGWIADAMATQLADDTYMGKTPSDFVKPERISSSFEDRPRSARGYMVTWQNVPHTAVYAPYNWDHYSPLDSRGIDTLVESKQSILTNTWQLPNMTNEEEVKQYEIWATNWYSNFAGPEQNPFEPVSSMFYPLLSSSIDSVRASLGANAILRGSLNTQYFWSDMFRNVLQPDREGLIVVFHNPCNPVFSYQVDGGKVTYIGQGDHHDVQFDHLEVSTSLLQNPHFQTFNKTYSGIPLKDYFCPYTVKIYPSQLTEDIYRTNTPITLTIVSCLLWAFSSSIFLIYDSLVQRRQRSAERKVKKSNALVTSLFPSNVHQRLFAEGEDDVMVLEAPNKKRLRKFLLSTGDEDDDEQADGDNEFVIYKRKPIADYFSDVTILFADLCSFTAWSSTRQPSEVFMLLETLYHAFDEIASRYRIFKVETVGDCYVAVAGLPDPRKDHAMVMARFAHRCLRRSKQVLKKLEVMLGPDTADLKIRFGLHSGPVTAGVLRGERSRFQLFGDTMNTTSRMESTSLPNRIQMSEATAKLLRTSGKDTWIQPRLDAIDVKGKGVMKTFLLRESLSDPDDCSVVSSHSGGDHGFDQYDQEAKQFRQVQWTVEVMGGLLKQVRAKRSDGLQGHLNNDDELHDPAKTVDGIPTRVGATVLDEVQEIVHLPRFDSTTKRTSDSDDIELGPGVEEELEAFISCVAELYNNNPFHNFEHATHVTMSVIKLMSRIVAPDLGDCKVTEAASKLHDHTYGITSDPLTQFACAFSAIIHDADHPGVSNTRLMEENPALGELYRNRSVAEQNSVDLTWKLLMQDRFAALRFEIYGNNVEEQKRFRALVVNSVMATDVSGIVPSTASSMQHLFQIMDKHLKELRNNRWNKAFNVEQEFDIVEPVHDSVNRKATIVIEHLIQASDVSHTMQHWEIYRRWNERLFEEMYSAYRMGRSDTNPGEFWVKGEIGFFDFYIIPLTKKLKSCGVFGSSSDEYLDYALSNRRDWIINGEEVVAAMLEKLEGREWPNLDATVPSEHGGLVQDTFSI